MKYGKDMLAPSGTLALLREFQHPSVLIRGGRWGTQKKGCYGQDGAPPKTQKEKRRNKRKEKENMWQTKNILNAKKEPEVVHYPAR